MQEGPFAALVWVVVVVVVGLLFARQRRRRGRVGAGAAGTVHEWLSREQRNAVQLIAEERAGAREPEDREGDLPQLEDPSRR